MTTTRNRMRYIGLIKDITQFENRFYRLLEEAQNIRQQLEEMTDKELKILACKMKERDCELNLIPTTFHEADFQDYDYEIKRLTKYFQE